MRSSGTKLIQSFTVLSIIAGLLFCLTPLTGTAKTDDDAARDLMAYISEISGISRGFCSFLGCGDGSLPLEASQWDGFYVHAQDSRKEIIDSLRKAAIDKGIYGKSILAEEHATGSFPYTDNLVDLLIVPDITEDLLKSITPAEILRVVRPKGKAVLGNTQTSAGLSTALQSWLAGIPEKNKETIQNSEGLWAVISKPPLQGIDEWTHWEHSPDNNPVSTDQLIKAPYMTQWTGRPYYIAMPAVTVSSDGRIFIAMGHIAHHEREEKWLNTIFARNAYNGTELWMRKLPDGYLVHRSAFIASGDTFYMIDPSGNGCLLLDAETGDEKARIRPPQLRGDWKWIGKVGNTLYVLAGKQKDPAETTVVRSEMSHWSWGELSNGYYADRVPWGFGDTIAAIDLKSEKPIWIHREEQPVDSRAMVIGGGKMYIYGPDSYIGCLDIENGEVLWTNTDEEVRGLIEEPGRGLGSTPGFRTTNFVLYTPDVVFYEAQTRMNLVAVSSKDGKYLWHKKKTTNNPNMIYADDHLYVGIGPEGNTLMIEPLTGAVIQDLEFAKRSCARLTATPDSFFVRGMPEGLTRYDRNTGQIHYNGAVRPACNDGVIAANGLLYMGPWLCDCNLSIMGRLALSSAGDFDFEAVATDADRLERASGGTDVTPLPSGDNEWPTYRGNNDRSSSINVEMPDDVNPVWSYRPQHEFMPTAPVLAGGLLFIGGEDGTIRAIDVRTGILKWTYVTAGPIQHAPTVWNSRVYAGSGDGYIYALEAATGRLLWRFRASPKERRIMCYGALRSTWPVNTGVLVHDGVAYAGAGVIDYDGTYMYALDAITGEIKWQNNYSGHLDKELRKGVSAQGTLTIADERLWMPGGNVVSPAIYRLDNGEYDGEKPFDGSPRSNRGEEIGVINGRYILLGGRLRFSATENVVNPGQFHIFSTASKKQTMDQQAIVANGKITPAWDEQYLYAVNGRNTPPVCYKISGLDDCIKKANPLEVGLKPKWTAKILNGRDTVSLLAAKNALLSVNESPRFRDLRSLWSLSAIRLENGNLMWDQDLSAPALPGGLLAGSDGRIIVASTNGQIDCYGGVDVLNNYVAAVREMTADNEESKRISISLLRNSLETTYNPDSRKALSAALDDLGYVVGQAAEEAGYITSWRLVGPFAWSPQEPEDDSAILEYCQKPSDTVLTIEGQEYRWRKYMSGDDYGKVDLVPIFGTEDFKCAYGYTEIELPADQKIQLKIGSNDGFRCWFNGEMAGRQDGGRTYGPAQNLLEVQGKKGKNTILIKITQYGGSWAFGAGLADMEDKPFNLVGKLNID